MAMYNRYIPDGRGFTRIVEEDDEPPFRPPEAPEDRGQGQAAPAEEPAFVPPAEAGEPEAPAAKKGGLSSLLKGLKLDDLDTGDILLLLIILFLFLDGDDIELIITLGLLLVLGLD